MTRDSLHRHGQALCNALPLATAVLFIFAGVLVLPLPYIGGIAPMFGLVAVYYWSIYRPDLFQPIFVFALGLLNDALHMMPLGLSAAIYLCLYQLIFTQRRIFVGQMFLVIWTGFALTALLTVAVQWVALSLYRDQMLSLQPVLLQYLLTVALFPLPAWVLMRLQRAFLSQG
ncbi:MAG TPA: rod shape-determining protein MreD [Rhodospirillaceae bacterium]|nr:rod shape-determining protein MreD [Rhodospirillaceae bacterium]